MSRGGPAGTAQLLDDLHQSMTNSLESWQTALTKYQVGSYCGYYYSIIYIHDLTPGLGLVTDDDGLVQEALKGMSPWGDAAILELASRHVQDILNTFMQVSPIENTGLLGQGFIPDLLVLCYWILITTQRAQATFLARLHAEYDRRKRAERSLAKKKADLAVSGAPLKVGVGCFPLFD